MLATYSYSFVPELFVLASYNLILFNSFNRRLNKDNIEFVISEGHCSSAGLQKCQGWYAGNENVKGVVCSAC